MPFTITRVAGLLLLAALISAPASAQIVQSLHLGGGAFLPKGEDARATGDVLNENLNSLAFKIGDFNSGQVFGEWLVAFGNHVEIGAGVGFHAGGAPTVSRDYTHPNGTEIEADLHLRVVPVTGVVRFLGGRPGRFQPYVGVGVAALNFRYTESGEFIDFGELDATGAFVTFRNRYTATGTAVGPLIMAGFRAPINGDVYNFTMEWRHQLGVGNTGGLQAGFLNDKIDLGGNNISFGFLVRF